MRSHQQIVRDHGAAKLARELKAKGVLIAVNTPQRWGERDRIPPEYFGVLVEIGAASDDELREGLRPRKRREQPDRAAA